MEVPVVVRVQGALFILAGVLNLVFGWAVSSMILGTFGTLCSSIVTLGLCPFGALCYFVPFLIIPVAVVEIIAGIVIAAVPDVVRPAIRIIPALGLLPIVIGDFISPVAAVVALGLGFTGEVGEWIEQKG